MAGEKRKNVSFRLKVDVIEMLDKLQEAYEIKLNERVPLDLKFSRFELSKTKILEILIESAWDEVQNRTKENDE